MKRGTHRYRSEAEEAQAQLYIEFLKTVQNITNQKSLDAYKGAVTARGKLTEAVRAAGLLENGAESLLTVTAPEQVQAVRDWWVREGRFGYSGPQAHMGHWLAFRGIPSEDRQAPERVLPQRLQVPPHGVRLRFLSQAFFSNYKITSVEKSMDLYARLLGPLAGQQSRFFCTTDSLKEYTADFRKLRLSILKQIEDSPEKTAVAVAAAFHSGLEGGCRNIVTQVMAQYGAQLLTDLARRPVAYRDSLLSCLEALRSACQGTNSNEACAQALLSLIRTVLLDCDPSRQSGDTSLAPGAALRDSRLWDSGLLWNWIDQEPLSDGETAILLQLPFPTKKDQQAHLAVALLHSMLLLAGKPNGRQKPSAWGEEDWHEAARWLESSIVFCGKFWDALYPSLAQPTVPWCKVTPEPQLLGGAKGSLFHADLLCRQAELLLRMPVWNLSKARQSVRLGRAQIAAKEGAAIVKKRLADRQGLLEALTGQGTARQTLARLCLCDAESYRRFAVLEKEENCLTDVLDMYIRPCRAALTDADAFSLLSDKAYVSLEKQRLQVCRDCYGTFFEASSPFVQRLRLLPDTDDRLYQAEQNAWEESFGGLLLKLQTAPHVVLPLDPETLRDPERFKTVYSGAFDSVLGKDPAQQKPAELAVFQLLSSSQTSLLQMPQLLDNLTALRLLHEPGFRTACREGIITLSCFLNIHSPELYLKQKLLDPGFRFSCSQAFTLPENIKDLDEDKQQKLIQRGARGVMLRYLESKATLEDFPDECDREEMAFLAESWKIAFDSFQLSDLRRYHQNSSFRYPPRKENPQKAPHRSLSEVLHHRIDLLIQEAQQPGSTKDLQRLLAVRTWADQIGDFPVRSAYDNTIDALLKKNSDPSLEDLRSVVHQSYFLSNGSLCCEHILLTERNPNFVLLAQEEGPVVTYEKQETTPTTEYVYRQAWKPGTDKNIGWPDLCEIALINRELTLRSENQSVDKQIGERERETGLKYCKQGDDIVADDYTAKLACGEQVHVCPAEKDAPDTRLLEMHQETHKKP